MVTAFTLPRVLARTPSPAVRVGAVTTRNLIAVRHSGYWLVVVSGLFEPVLYLFSIGIGVGGLLPAFTLPDGQVISYAVFVAPAILAAAALNGAMAVSSFNFYARLAWARLYDAMIATPLRPFEIALGELGWALIRGAAYAAAFLALMVGLGLTTAGWALLAFFAALLIGFAFGAAGMAVATFIRTWQDFDYINLVQFALFLFSGTFVPVASYDLVPRLLIQATPLYQGVELVRSLTLGQPTIHTLGNVAYLASLSLLGLWVAGRRMTAKLCK